MIRQMILDSHAARKFAGRVTAEMIRLGASPNVMRENGIPGGIYHWVWGARAWTKSSPKESAEYLIGIYKPRLIFLHND